MNLFSSPAPSSFSTRRRSRGIALPVVLLLLVAITVPAVILLRQSLLNERMAGATVDHSSAFEAAEAGLLVAEAFALSRPSVPANGCSGGICATPDPSHTPVWEQPALWESASLEAPSVNGATVRYLVEYMGTSQGLDHDCTTGGDVSLDAACNNEAFLYRITVLGQSESGARAIVQTAYLVP